MAPVTPLLLAACVSSASAFGAWTARAPRVGTARRVFSGIVEEVGSVVSLTRDKEMTLWDGSVGLGTELVVDGAVASEGAYIGCSIAVNGVCLTATVLSVDDAPSHFAVGLSPETLRRTNLGAVRAGDPVNLERSLAADGRNSGHYVQGHVDGTGAVRRTWVEGDSLWVEVGCDADLLACVVPKGYVAIDGTSLTVCDVLPDGFTVMLVEHTQKRIVLPLRRVGDAVNLEVDVIAKYARRSAGDVAALEARVAALEARVAAAAEE